MENEYYKQFEPIFGSWKIIRLLGEGSFGKVFEIEKEEFGAVYKSALKVITIPQSESDLRSAEADGMDEESIATYYRSFVEDFSKESALMSKLKGHTNIVSFEDTQILEHKDSIGWDIFIRMELLTPLNAYLKKKGGSLSADESAKLGIDLCKALELCEKFNIIHRDIKPENIFISETGDFKLGDFGISRMAEKTRGASTKVGTRDYMAPEVFRSERYDQTVDIYSLSLVIYKLLNGNRLPFLPPAPQAITFSQRNEALEKRVSGAKIEPPLGADAELASVVLKGCSPDSKDRYQNASDMRKAIEKCIAEKQDAGALVSAVAADLAMNPKASEMYDVTVGRDANGIRSESESNETHDETMGRDWNETIGRDLNETMAENAPIETFDKTEGSDWSETVGADYVENNTEKEKPDSIDKTVGYDWSDKPVTRPLASPKQGFGPEHKTNSQGIPLAAKIGIGIACALVLICAIVVIGSRRRGSSYDYMSNVSSYSSMTDSSSSDSGTSADPHETTYNDSSETTNNSATQTTASNVSDTKNDSNKSPGYCTVSDSVKVRKSADYEAEVIGVASQGETYEIIDESDPNWTQINYNGQTAYLVSPFVVKVESNSLSSGAYSEEDDDLEIPHEIGTYSPSTYKHLSWDHSVQDILYSYSTNVILQQKMYNTEVDLSEFFDAYHAVDIDGDGYFDSVCATISDSDYTSTITIRFGNGDEIVSGPFSMSPNEGQMVYFIDLNGDKVDEILVTHLTESTAGPVAWNCYLYEWSGNGWKARKIVNDEGCPMLGDVDSMFTGNGSNWSMRDVQLCDDYLLYLVDYGYKDGPEQTFDFEVFCFAYDGNNWQFIERSKESGWDISEWAWRVGL